MTSVRKHARVAGLWYLAMGITAPIGLMFVPDKVFVRGDATATADLLRANEPLVRLGIGSELFHQAVAVFLVLALYRLFKPVSQFLAWHLVCLGALVSVPIMFLNVLNEIAALTLVSGASFLSAFDKPQIDALAYVFMRLHGLGIVVASVFWGLWLFPFGLLVIRSGFIPWVLGAMLIVAGIGYLAAATTILVLPQLASTVNPVAQLLELAEVPIIFWLAIWGAREKRTGNATA